MHTVSDSNSRRLLVSSVTKGNASDCDDAGFSSSAAVVTSRHQRANSPLVTATGSHGVRRLTGSPTSTVKLPMLLHSLIFAVSNCSTAKPCRCKQVHLKRYDEKVNCSSMSNSGWPALLTSGFSGNLAFESNKYLLLLLYSLM